MPELIERVRDAEDLYFDAVSQVRLDTWSRGRIALLGDAASYAGRAAFPRSAAASR